MGISDWSSDVCSSYLIPLVQLEPVVGRRQVDVELTRQIEDDFVPRMYAVLAHGAGDEIDHPSRKLTGAYENGFADRVLLAVHEVQGLSLGDRYQATFALGLASRLCQHLRPLAQPIRTPRIAVQTGKA